VFHCVSDSFFYICSSERRRLSLFTPVSGRQSVHRALFCNDRSNSMKTRQWLGIGAFASAALITGSALAAGASVTTTQMQNGPSTMAPAPNRVSPDPRSIGGSERIDNTNGVPASKNATPQWSDYDVPTNYPTRDLSLPPRTGSDVIPDYMGPGSVRGQ